MSRIYAVYTRHLIDEGAFTRTLEEIGGSVSAPTTDDLILEGHFRQEGVGSVEISLCRDVMSELHDEEDKKLFDALGGKPMAKIGLEPSKWSDKPLIDYLAALAEELDYVVTNFDKVLMTGNDVREKQKLGWTTLDPA